MSSLFLHLFILIFLSFTTLNSKYLDSKSCNECHPKIYEEHIKSMHSKSSIFVDEIHTKLKEQISPDKYDCALCHTPAVSNLRSLIKGESQPKKDDKQLLEGVSCFYCHQINKVLYTKHYGINFSSYKGEPKPTFFGNLNNVEDSDKHKSSSEHIIYENSQICMGCHAYKKNSNDVEICSTLVEYKKTSDCISCHMPKQKGSGPTKLNAKQREEYTTHEFLGIHSKTMVKQAVDLKLKQLNNSSFELSIKNKMGHSIITQPMRLKIVKTQITRDGKVIWSNFKDSPLEDKNATFAVIFKDKDDNPTFPPNAVGYKYNNNIDSEKEKKIIYNVELKKGDIIKSTWISYIISPSIAKKLDIKDEKLKKPIIGQTIQFIVE